MKKLLFFPLILLSALFASCDPHASDNGDLDGFWQLACVDTLQGGSTDVTRRRLFWSVQFNLLQVSELNTLKEYVFHFSCDGNTLQLRDPYLVDHAGSDVAVTDVTDLHPYGIQSLSESFTIECLNDDQLLLRSQTLRLHFRRY